MIHKTTRSILSVLLAALLLVTSTPLTPAFAGEGAVSPQSESGESEGLEKVNGEYQIGSAEDLREFAELVNGTAEGIGQNTSANAKLMNDIDLSSVCSEKNGTWTPIGSDSNPYRGTFNGDGHTISGLYINDSSADYQGLFGYVSGSGKIENLSVSGTVSGGMCVGGIAGQNNGNVEDCDFTGSVSGSDHVGGVVGWNISGGNVKNCYNTGEVSGSSYVGGVVGENLGSSTAENCYNTGTVTGSPVGGVVGSNSFSATVTNCYNTGTVSGPDSGSGNSVGGVVGYNSGIGNVKNCYNTGTVTGTDDYVGGVVGYNDVGGVTNCYNTGEVSGNQVGGVVGLNNGPVTGCYFLQDTAEKGIGSGNASADATPVDDLDALCGKFKDDTTNTWSIHPVLGRPVLNENKEGGDGTKEHPYEIKTATQLKNFATAVNKGIEKSAHAKLMNNIDLSSVCSKENGNWTPIGNDAHQYIGTFDGNGKTIKNLYINNTSSDTDYQGLFGYVSGTVKDLTVSGSVSGDWYVGGVVGYNNGGTVTGCIFSSSGSVSGSDHVGGVVGSNNNGTVENCYNTGKVTGSSEYSYIGGVVGYNSGTVKNCYNTGTVTGTGTDDYVGGVVGYNRSGGSVTNSYSTGAVSGLDSGTGNNVGGVVGLNSSSASVTNCYFLQTTEVNDKLQGIGDGSGVASNVEPKTAKDFHSGEVAYLLQSKQPAAEDGTIPQVWGQSNLNATTSLPTLNPTDEQKVYQVTFDYGTSFTENDGRFAYSYTNGVVSKPDKNPELDGHTLSGWYSDPSLTTAWTFDTEISNDKILYAKWTPVAEPEPTPTPTPDPTPSGPSTGDSSGWDDILDELENTAKGDQITIDMGDETKVPAEIFESLAGKDVDVTFDLGDIQWSASGADIPTDTDFTDLDLGVNLDTHGIPVNVINTITGEVGTVQITLAHNGEFGFTMTLTAPLGKENAGYWANLYHYDEDAEALNFEAAAKINEDGSVTIPFSHASQYAIVIDTHSHATVDVSDIFIDVAPNAWYKDAVQYAYAGGLMTGVSDTEFAPEATTTRAMIVSILARLEGVESAQAAGFADVDDNDWYATAVNWAASVGVVNGYEDNTFQPNTAITREQLAAILMNYAAYKGEDVSNRADLTSYTDQPSTWAKETMSWAVAEGLITGVTADTLQPQGAATRAQVAAILQRFLSE